MIAIGLDVHTKKTMIAKLDTDTGEISNRNVRTDDLTIELAGNDPQNTRIALEASATGMFVARTLMSSGFNVVVVESYRAHRIIESQNNAKTDKRDAIALAKLVGYGQADDMAVWVPDQTTRELRQLTRCRENLVSISTQLRNQLRAVIRSEGQNCRWRDLTGRQGRSWMERFIDAMPEIAALAWRAIWQSLLEIQERIDSLSKAIEKVVDTCPAARQLMTIHGCGAISALSIAAEIGDIRRFRAPKNLCGYSGLVPRTQQSADRIWVGPLVKKGNPHLRRSMVLLAQHVASSKAMNGTRLKRSYCRVLFKHGANPAKVHLARHLLRMIFAMLRDGTDFDTELMAA